MNDWEDRIVDSALQELGGQRPPDLSARILIALSERTGGSLPELRRRPTFALRSVLAAAAFMLLGVAVAFVISGLSAATDVAAEVQVEVRVYAGGVEYVGSSRGGATIEVAADAAVTVTARAGDRLRIARHSQVRLAAFPLLQVDPATELEVQSMEFSMKNGVVAASSMTLGVVAGIVTWNALTGPGAAGPGEVVRLEAQDERGAELMAENARLLERIRALELANDRLETVRNEVAAPPRPEQPAPGEVTEVPEPASAVVFADDNYADLLAKIDFALMGKTTFEMQPLMNELVRSLEEDGDFPPELAVKIEQLNANLLAQVPAMLEAGLPGTGANGAYTHPLVVANTLASTLQAAGQPLDAAQQGAIDGLVRSFGVELDAVAGSQFEFESELLLQEIETKDRFYEEMSSRLTPEQFEAIYPEGSTAFDGLSLFGTGLLSRQFVRPIRAADAADFARRAGSRLGDELGLSDADTTKLRSVIESVTGNTAELWRDKGSVAERKLKMMRRGRTTAALRSQIALLREISRRIPLTAEQKQKLASLKGILVPLPQ